MAFILPFTHKGITYQEGYWVVRPNLDEQSSDGIEIIIKNYRTVKKYLQAGEGYLRDYRLIIPTNHQYYDDYFSEPTVKPEGKSPKQNVYHLLLGYDGSYIPPTDSNTPRAIESVFAPIAAIDFTQAIGAFSQEDIDNLTINGYATVPEGLRIYNEDTGQFLIFTNGDWVVDF